MLKYILVAILMVCLVAFRPGLKKNLLKNDASVSELLEAFGADHDDKKANKKVGNVSARIGEDLVKNGFSKRDNLKKSKRQSKHFVCTSCHNVKREDPNLAIMDPQARLEYVSDKGLPFLQATTLYGAINRETFYNGDYEKKYGALVKPARNDIREAIQLCAVECAQGRKLKDWEMESIVAYLNDIDLTIGDLNLSADEKEQLTSALASGNMDESMVNLLESKYAQYSPATFVKPPEDRKEGSGLSGDPTNGKLIYDKSCLHCHYQKRYSFLHLDNMNMSVNHLKSNIATYSKHSLYQVTRWGTFSKFGKKSYMPRYTKERMSDQQLADLRAYIEL